MKFSIIVPVYQAEKYLERCINSIINQTFSSWELLLIDDGSSDGGPCICRKMSDIDKRICFFSHCNHGVSYSRNIGIKQAKGDYLIFVDADDELTTDALEDIEGVIHKNAEPDMVFWGYKTLLPRKNLNQFDMVPTDYVGRFIAGEFFEAFSELWKKNLIHNIGTKAYKRTEFLKNIRFNENIYCQEDALFCLNYLRYSSSFYVIHKSYYIYHLNENSHSLNNIYRRGLFEGYTELMDQLSLFCEEACKNLYISFFSGAVYAILDNEFRKSISCRKSFVFKAQELYENSKWRDFYCDYLKDERQYSFWGNRQKTTVLYWHMKRKNIHRRIKSFFWNDAIFDCLYDVLIFCRRKKQKVKLFFSQSKM